MLKLDALDGGLTTADWQILVADLPSVLQGMWRAKGIVNKGISTWEDLAQDVAIHLLRREEKGEGYNPDRGPLVAYVVQNADLVCLQLWRKEITRRKEKRAQFRAAAPHWARGTRLWEPPALLVLTDQERRWVEARQLLGSTDAASAAVGLTQREGRALAARIREALVRRDDPEPAVRAGSWTRTEYAEPSWVTSAAPNDE